MVKIDTITLILHLSYVADYVANTYGTAQLTHACWHTRMPARFTCVKVYNLACISSVARRFVVRTCAIKHLWHTRRAPYQQIIMSARLVNPA